MGINNKSLRNEQLRVGDKITVEGVEYVIKKSTRKNKDKMAIPVDKTLGLSPVHFGHPDHIVKTGTQYGDSYCARSKKIPRKKVKKGATPNDLARKDWGCVGDKSKDTRKRRKK